MFFNKLSEDRRNRLFGVTVLFIGCIAVAPREPIVLDAEQVRDGPCPCELTAFSLASASSCWGFTKHSFILLICLLF